MGEKWMFISDDENVGVTEQGWIALAEYARLLHGWHPNPERVAEIKARFIREGGARAKRIVDRMENEHMAVEYLCKVLVGLLTKETIVLGREN
jgi:hypothetical protein